MKIQVDRPTCLRSGQCWYLAPQLFAEGEDGYPVIRAPELEEGDVPEAEKMADLCPSGAISIEASDG